jgi:hypothetical protein
MAPNPQPISDLLFFCYSYNYYYIDKSTLPIIFSLNLAFALPDFVSVFMENRAKRFFLPLFLFLSLLPSLSLNPEVPRTKL